MKGYFLPIPFLFIVSCVSLHTPSTHFVPSIVKKNQFEGDATIGPKAVSVNCAYSPLNHITVMANVQALPFRKESSRYQRSCELALGLYGTKRKIIYGINAGYGLGGYNWAYSISDDSTFYSINTNGNFQKLMLQPFIGFTNDAYTPEWIVGFSIKANYFWDQYASLTYSARDHSNTFSGLKNNSSIEPCIFTRNFFNRSIYLNAQAGMNISYDVSMSLPTQYLFLRLGVGLKL